MNNQFFRRYLPVIFIIITAFLVVNAVIKILKHDVVETNILSLLPHNTNNDILKHADERISKNIERRLILLVGHSSAQNATKNAKNISTQLSQSNLFKSVESTVNTKMMDDLVNFYKTRNAPLLTSQQMQWMENNDIDAVRAHVLSNIYGLGGDVVDTDLTRDPLFFMNDYVGHIIQNDINKFDLVDEVPVIQKDNLYYALVRVELLKSPFSINYQKQVIDFLDNIKAGESTHIIRSSMLFHADYGTQIAKTEIGRMGVASIIGVFLLFLIVFKSVRPFVTVLTSIVGGGIVGVVSCLLFFDTIHLLTLVFGISLVGISVDYSFHFFAEKYNESGWNSGDAIGTILPGITMGLITSIFGFLGLCLTPITVLQQMAIFSIGGLCFVYACVVLFYPLIFRTLKKHPSHFMLNVSEKYMRCLSNIHHPKTFLMAVILATSLFVALPFLSGKDDIRAMQTPSQKLIDNDLAVSTILGMPLSTKIMVVRGKTHQNMMEKLYHVAEQLDNETSLSQYILPQSVQDKNRKALEIFLKNNEIELKKLFDDLGYENATYQKYLRSVQSMDNIELDDFLDVMNDENIRIFYSDTLVEKSLGFIFIKGNENKEFLQNIARADDDFFFVDKVDALTSSLNNTRFWVGILAIMAYGLIILLLVIRYGMLKGVAVVLPCVLAALFTLVIVCMFNGSYSLFHILALFLVMGIGVDYGLFLVEGMTDKNPQKTNRIMTAIILSAITTLMSFGLLSTSATSALHDFGITVILGIVMIFFLSPLILFSLVNTEEKNE